MCWIFIREKEEKQMDELKQEKKKLEYYTDLLKAGEVNKENLNKMKAILNE